METTQDDITPEDLAAANADAWEATDWLMPEEPEGEVVMVGTEPVIVWTAADLPVTPRFNAWLAERVRDHLRGEPCTLPTIPQSPELTRWAVPNDCTDDDTPRVVRIHGPWSGDGSVFEVSEDVYPELSRWFDWVAATGNEGRSVGVDLAK